MAFMRVLCVLVFAVTLLAACTDRVICPAFQSTYILDDSTRIAFYSYAWKLDESTRQQYIASLSAVDATQSLAVATTPADSLGIGDAPSNNWSEYYAYAGEYVPKGEQVRKTKYGIIRRQPHWLKTYELRTAPMVNVYGPEREHTESVDEGEFFASDFDTRDSLGVVSGDPSALDPGITDSLSLVSGDPDAMDSTAMADARPGSERKKKAPKYRFGYDPKDNFNVEQDYYNKYFGKLLLDNRPDPKPAPADSLANPSDQPDSLQNNQKKGLGGLFKRKKKKEKDDPASEEGLPIEGVPAEEANNEEGAPEGGGGF